MVGVEYRNNLSSSSSFSRYNSEAKEVGQPCFWPVNHLCVICKPHCLKKNLNFVLRSSKIWSSYDSALLGCGWQKATSLAGAKCPGRFLRVGVSQGTHETRMQPALGKSLKSRPRQPSDSLSLSLSILSSHFYLAFPTRTMIAAESSFSSALNLFGGKQLSQMLNDLDSVAGSNLPSQHQCWRNEMRGSPMSQMFSAQWGTNTQNTDMAAQDPSLWIATHSQD